MPDDLYTRYMKAHQDNETHKASCTRCTPDGPCPTGQPAFDKLARLQDAYLQRQRDRRPRQP